jgi:hypothetical protein
MKDHPWWAGQVEQTDEPFMVGSQVEWVKESSMVGKLGGVWKSMWRELKDCSKTSFCPSRMLGD